ncbi:MAG: NUDIX domain-containing protein [Candidatus Woesearchaeota archaeon]
MELIKEIMDGKPDKHTRTRESSRALLFDEEGNVPLLFGSRYNFYQLPGGGIKGGETRVEALVREMREEVGCEIEISGEIGKIIEYKSRENVKHTSYFYLGKVVSKGKPCYTKDEKEMGFSVVWVSIGEAISVIENDTSTHYDARFRKERDLAILKAFQKE